MKSRYLIWKAANPPRVCLLKNVVGLEKQWDLMEGRPRTEGAPGSIEFHMDPDFPKNTLLADHLSSVSVMLVVSARLQSFLSANIVSDVEYFPTKILDHKGRVASGDYFVVNPINPVNCIDLEKSKPTYSLIKADSIRSLDRLVLNEKVVPKERTLFRPKSFFHITLVDRNLAAAIEREKFSGVRWVETDDYPE